SRKTPEIRRRSAGDAAFSGRFFIYVVGVSFFDAGISKDGGGRSKR
ncbi:MAG: hypothetical protein XD63_1601, partial [Thermoanaerobacterales bacterium 50_218]